MEGRILNVFSQSDIVELINAVGFPMRCSHPPSPNSNLSAVNNHMKLIFRVLHVKNLLMVSGIICRTAAKRLFGDSINILEKTETLFLEEDPMYQSLTF